MSAVKTYHLQCNNCGEVFAPAEPYATATAVRTEAAQEGWTHRLGAAISGPAPSLDLCPACSAAPAEAA